MKNKIPYKNTFIHYGDEGNGNALIFLHGFPESKEIWNDFIEVLSKKYRVITIDLLGHGESGCTNEKHTMEEIAETVNIVLDSCHVDNCMLIGHSMGGYITLAFAELFPQKLKGICMFHSSALADTEEKKENRLRAIEFVKENHDQFINELIPTFFAPQNLILFEKEVEAMKALAKKNSTEGIAAALAGMRDRKERLNILKNIKVPVLFLLGRYDSLMPVDKLLPQIGLPKNSLTIVLENSGHMGFIEEKEEAIFTIDNYAIYCFS